ncbi:MAG TPA: NADH-quinone oxidoreductase subunit N [Nitriliruptorales bacterium]|nr:NADH-quinone oxidoreductase subunit N [Nitriliruptorales bacterium]
MAPFVAQASDRLPAPSVEFSAFAPELLLVGAALLLLVVAVAGPARGLVTGGGAAVAVGVGVWLLFRGFTVPGAVSVAVGAGTGAVAVAFATRPQLVQVWAAGLALAGALALTVWQWGDLYQQGGGGTFLSGALALDGVALYTRVTVFTTGLLVLPIGYGYLLERGIYRLEFEPLLLLSVTGMTIIGAAGDLLVAFIAFELLSVPLYVMAGMALRDRRSQEAAIKYFVMGAVASAILVYGIALLYTATGTIDLGLVGDGVTLIGVPQGVVMLGLALVTVGLGFKAAAVPFHFWVPDVYQGAPTNVTAFMAAATKAAAFAIVLRIFLVAFGPLDSSWVPVLATIAAVTMMLGALAAIVQRDVKRVLAYSSVAHVGYALIGVTSSSPEGVSATLYYLLTYAVSAVAAFGCVVAIERRRRGEVALVDLKGMGRTSPVLAGVFGLSLLSLAGIPATAGFAGKFAVFRAGVLADLEWLVVVGVVSSVVAAFFYLRLIGAMFLEEPDDDRAWQPVLSTGISAGIAAAAAAVVVLGVLPDAFVTLADQAATIAR